MQCLRPPKRFPAPEEMDNEETATWISWIHQETHALLEDLNEEVRLQNDMDDPFTKNIVYATGSHHTSSPVYVYLIAGICRQAESFEIPPIWRPVRVCM